MGGRKMQLRLEPRYVFLFILLNLLLMILFTVLRTKGVQTMKLRFIVCTLGLRHVSSPWYVLVSYFVFITAIIFLGRIHNGGTIGEFTTTATGRGRGAKVMRTVWAQDADASRTP